MGKNYLQLVKSIIMYVGEEENIESLTHCMTRLRFILKDEKKVQIEKLKQLDGVINVLVSGGQFQVVIGTHVEEIYKEIIANYNIAGTKNKIVDDEKKKDKRNIIESFMEIVSGLFLPLMKPLCAAGILKGLLIAFSSLNLISQESGTYAILYAAADAFFYFLPIFLAFTAAEKFKADKFISVLIAGAMIYPGIINMYNEGAAVRFLGIPVNLVNYTSTVIPIIVVVYVLSKLEKVLNKIIPSLLKNIFVPLISIVLMLPLALIIFGPVTNEIGNLIATGYTFFYNLSPVVAGGILALLWPIMIVFGVHWGLVPIVFNNISMYGYDTLLPVTIATNFAMAGAVFGVFLKTKNKELKELSLSSTISALVGGVTEPAIYGVNMKYRKPFYIACVFSGIGGLIVGSVGAQWPGLMTVCLITLPTLGILKGGVTVLIAAAVGFVGSTIFTYFFGFNDSMIGKK